jgi:hypothetical protein
MIEHLGMHSTIAKQLNIEIEKTVLKPWTNDI